MLGGLVGFNTGTVQNSSVTNTAITGNIATAGGLVGINNGQITGASPGQVSANTTITLDGANSIGGGLVGTNNASGVIHNATAAGSLNRRRRLRRPDDELRRSRRMESRRHRQFDRIDRR